MSDPAACQIGTAAATRRFAPLVLVLAALAAGVLADRCLAFPAGAWMSAGVVGWLGWLFFWLCGRTRISAWILLGAVACVGAARHHAHWNLYPADELGQAAGDAPRPVCLRAIALTSPRRVAAPPDSPLRTRPAGERSRLLVGVTHARHGLAWRPASGRAELYVDGHVLGVRAGDHLQVFALFNRPPGPLNPGEFDVAWQRRSDRQLVQLEGRFPDGLTTLARGTLWDWRRWLAIVRDPCHGLLWSCLGGRTHQPGGEDEAGLASALLLGAREHLDWERTEPFVTTGTVHLLAISGVHVGILAFGFWWVARLLAVRRHAAIGCVILFVTGYALLTDARPPVVRAAILVTAFCLARLSARRPSGFNSLAAAGVAIVAWNPTALFQAGAQFSFLAVAAIYLWGPHLTAPATLDPLDRLIERSRPWYLRWGRGVRQGVRSLILISVVVWLVTLPLTALRYHLLSPIALVLNPVLWIPVTVALFSGFLILVFGWLVPPLGQVCGGICRLSLTALEGLVDRADQIPGGHFWTPAPAGWWVLGAYVGLGLYAVFLRRRLPVRWCLAALALWLGLGAMTTVRQLPWPAAREDSVICTFLAVGHGACTVVELPQGQTLLYDAGAMGAPESTARTIAEFLWTRRITHLDAIVVTHADADHYNAIPELLKRFSVGAVYVSPVMFENRTPALAALHSAVAERGLPLGETYGGDRLRIRGSSRLSILHPPRRGVVGSDNANSLTLQIDHAGRRILLTGDLEPPGLDDLLACEPVDFDVVLAPHHGSPRSEPERFVAWCRPEWMIVSAAANEGAAASQTANASLPRRVLNTGRAGAVQVTIDGSGLRVRTWRGSPW